MESPTRRARKSLAPRDEFKSARAAGERGRPTARGPVPQQLESSGTASSFAHGEDSQFDSPWSPPQHDRAG
jgi:hypothetical protein